MCDRFKDAVTNVKDSLLAQGYPSFTLEDFHDTVRDRPRLVRVVSLNELEPVLSQICDNTSTSKQVIGC